LQFKQSFESSRFSPVFYTATYMPDRKSNIRGQLALGVLI